MTRFPVFGTYYICLSHHVLTWNYSSCVSCISYLWWDTFKLAVWYWFASFIWFLACIDSNKFKHLVLSLHFINHTCQYVTASRFSYIFHPPIMRPPYMKVVFVSIMHQWVLKRKFYSFFLWVWLDKAKSRKRKEKSKEGDDGGPLQQCKWSICTDSPCTDSALQAPSLRSPTPPSKVLALTWQCDIWLHVAYGV